ncbi:glycosyltransferase [Liquorilactobacillus capillatus]|uniref:Glycosyl transferase, group 1 family protein n=1 Tax=Liquorilactobacillus capillatus DSM 19910 TaxID=1423731 RepID=A0A0R1M294_9LACO|nr:glycosyltransferase [Liquorilactobacillus capillatus]KRL02140.1 glycosyl transferase, group 1 family protein [Liquorilactobacillus capillatus DSM 19910]
MRNSESKTIIVLGSFNTNNGITTFVKNNYASLKKDGFKFEFINIANSAPATELAELGDYIQVVQLKLGLLKHINGLKQALKDACQRSTTIHMHLDSLHNFIPLVLAKIVGFKRIIIHAHSDQRGQYSLLKTTAHRLGMCITGMLATDYLACSQNAADFFYSHKVQQRSTFKIIINGVELDSFKYNREKSLLVRKKLKIPESSVVIGHCGRFARQKNHPFLIKTFKIFHDKYPHSILILVGNGEHFERIQQMVASLGLQNNVRFLGYIDNVAEIQNAFDIFAFPSLYEGLSLSLVENLANGTECLISENQSPESFLAPTAHKMPISTKISANKWAEKMLSFDGLLAHKSSKEINSQKNIKILRTKGFDKETTVASLRKIYEN